MHRVVWFVVRLVAMVLICAVLDGTSQAPETRARMEAVLRYAGLASPAPEDVARMAELWTHAQQEGLSSEDRRAAFRDLYLLYAKLHGRDLSSRPQALDGLARFVVSNFESGARMHLALPEPRGKPSGNYLHVETRGTGPVPLLLISDLGVDGRNLYDSFARRQASAYTMHIVTLPFAGAARPMPWPETLDYALRPWLNQIEKELLALVDQPTMKGVTVVGTSAGGYFAARLGLLRPKQLRAVVLVHALVNSPMRSLADPDAPATMEERRMRLRSVPPAPQLFPFAPVPPPEELRRLIADPNSQHPTARNWMAFSVKDAAVSQAWTYEALSTGFFLPGGVYGFEMLSTDLTEQMKDLAIPMLAMGSFHDEGSPVQSPPSVSQWEEMKLLYPSIPLTIAAFEDTRAYLSEDAPKEFDRALEDFLAGRPVRGKTGYHLPRTSPRAAVMQSVGGAEIRITFGRPAAKGRKIWGELIPYGRVWRAGANEATTVTFTRDVLVEGNALRAGTYTLFLIPTENEWTVIFNRVPRQWGAFNYNTAFDALRVAVRPTEEEHEEWLSYRISSVEANAAVVTMAWEQKRLSLRVEAGAK